MATSPDDVSVSRAMVHGPFLLEEMVCQKSHRILSKGYWYGDDPLDFTFPLLMLQMAGVILTTRLIFHVLKPLHQGMITAQVVAGIFLGPSMLGHNQAYTDRYFPPGGKLTLQTLSNLGFVIHFFLLGVRIDPTILRKAGSKAILIGVSTFALPFTVGSLTYLAISHSLNLPKQMIVGFSCIVSLNSMSSFPVTTTVLIELNILNSEIGKLATNVSMVCEICSWVVAAVFNFYTNKQSFGNFWGLVFVAILLLTVVFICRPLIKWLTKRKARKLEQEGEIPYFPIVVIMLLTALVGEVIGVHAAFGVFWLGIALPDGPPVGTALVKKLDTFATILLLPCFIGITGLQTDFFLVGDKHPYAIELVIIVTYICKFSGTIGSSMYCSLPFWDALCLGLVMCCQGLVEVSACTMWKDAKLLNPECFNLIIISLLLVTGVSRILIVHLYDPSKRYKTSSKRTILQSRQRNIPLRLLVCVHSAENVPTFVNILEASNPTRFSPISIFTLHLIELKGRSHSVLVPHHHLKKLDPNAIKSEQIVNAFLRFEQAHQGSVTAQHFTCIAPYPSMHDDVCTLALDKKATLIILPFHKQYAIDGSVGSVNPFIRNINKHVLDKAPCSVGVLIDRNETAGNRSILKGHSWYSVALLFFGSADDMEALSLCIRMAEHQQVSITVIQFKHKPSQNEKVDYLEKQLINDFRSYATNKGKVQYIEENVKDGVDTTKVISSLGETYDLVIVGGDHDPDSLLLSGLTEWSECPELGVVGDLLASPDFHFSVLVVHQQQGEYQLDNTYMLPITNPKSSDTSSYPRFSKEEDYTAINIGRL